MSRISNHTETEGRRQALIEEVGRATQAYQRATDGFDDAVGGILGLNPTDLRCLDWLTQGPMAAGELTDAIGLSTAATTTLLDRLEQKQFVRRQRDTDDRRRVIVMLTLDGERRLRSLYGPLADRGGELLARFSERELSRIRDFLVDATSVVESAEADLRGS